MIKVCKLLLHMINNTNIRIIEEKSDLKREIDDIFELKDGSVKSQLEEISTVMHNVHQDFEINRSNHTSEIADMSLKVGKMQDICNQSLDYIDEVKDSQEKIATIVTCLLEFNSIEQALSF